MSETAALDQMMNDDRWLGFGYLGERRNALASTDPEAPAQPELVEQADTLVMSLTADWTADERFHWANSKDGRWFGDCMFGGFPEQAHRHVRKQVVR